MRESDLLTTIVYLASEILHFAGLWQANSRGVCAIPKEYVQKELTTSINNSQRAAKLHGQLRKFKQNLSAEGILTQTGKRIYFYFIPPINFQVPHALLS